MRLNRVSWLVPAVLASVVVGACKHDDPVEIISRNGEDSIPVIDLSPAAAGFLGGTRVTNQFLFAGFDTSIVDAFGRASANPANYRAETACYGTTRLIYPVPPPVATYTPPNRYLPALVSPRTARDVGCGTATAYIVPGNHPGNGNTPVWEFWYDFVGVASVRYIQGLVRYALVQRGALDISEILQTGTVTQPDSLVFMAGDFNPGGKKSRDAYITSCTTAGVAQPIARANPHFMGSDTARGASLGVDIDQTACSDATSPWFNGIGNVNSPVPGNTFPIAAGGNQYNFIVIWEALPDSTPNYARPVYREQIGPLMTTTGRFLNNGYAPVPTAALAQTVLVLRPGGIGRADSVKVTADNLMPLATGAYQAYVVRSGTDTAALVTARVIRLKSTDTTVRDTLLNATSFNTTATLDRVRAEFSLGTYFTATVPYDRVVLAVAPTAGTATLPASQPLWASVQKQAGTTAATTTSLLFGSFNRGKTPPGSPLYGAAGSGTGGLFGLELREDVKRLPRPPVGYTYEAWLTNTADATKRVNLGPLLTPYPDLQPLTDADTRQSAPLSGAEITQVAVRMVADSIGFYCQRVGTTGAFARNYDRLQIRLTPRNGSASLLPPAVVLSGTVNLLARVVNDSVKTCS